MILLPLHAEHLVGIVDAVSDAAVTLRVRAASSVNGAWTERRWARVHFPEGLYSGQLLDIRLAPGRLAITPQD